MVTHTNKKRNLIFWLFYLTLFTFPAVAQVQVYTPIIASQSAVVMDANTGTIVFSQNPDDEIPPASLTKLMTTHLALKEVEAGRASLDEIIIPPRASWAVNQPPFSSLMSLAPGQRLSLRELLLGMATFSGNDAATAVALRFAPSVEVFTQMMTREAWAMGLTKTRFVDASGYSDLNMTTAREFAEFSRLYIASHPDSLTEFHSVREFSYPRAENVAEQFMNNPRTRTQRSRNNLLGRVEGVDGLKTGYIPESGYNIALTAERNGTRFIAVILGAPSGSIGERSRDTDGENLLNWAFERFKTIRVSLGTPEPARIWKGRENNVNVVINDPLEFTAFAERGEQMSFAIYYNEPIIAPLPAGSFVGNIIIFDKFGEFRRISLVTAQEAQRGGIFKRFFDSIRLFFLNLSRRQQLINQRN